VFDQVQGGARAVAGDQQVAPIRGRELSDGLVETSMWSTAVLEPALPGRSRNANDSL
jgi:hypothetical protein